jgi:hypothetical protein
MNSPTTKSNTANETVVHSHEILRGGNPVYKTIFRLRTQEYGTITLVKRLLLTTYFREAPAFHICSYFEPGQIAEVTTAVINEFLKITF